MSTKNTQDKEEIRPNYRYMLLRKNLLVWYNAPGFYVSLSDNKLLVTVKAVELVITYSTNVSAEP